MKKLTTLAMFILSTTALTAQAKEQCSVIRSSRATLTANSVITITLPNQAEGDRFRLSGYNLDCDNRDDHWCAFDVETNSDETSYTMEDGSILTVERDINGNLEGKGTFTSPTYTGNKVLKLSCSVLEYSPK